MIAKKGLSRSSLHFPVRDPEGFRVVETCNRPVVVEWLRSVCAVQDGVQPVSSPVHQEFRLGDLHRFEDTYLLVPFYQSSRQFLRIVVKVGVCQFKALCFGLATAPQVFTRVVAPVSSFFTARPFGCCIIWTTGWC